MPLPSSRRAALPSVSLFCSGLLLGAAAMATGFLLSGARELPEAASPTASLEPVSGVAGAPTAVEPVAPAEPAAVDPELAEDADPVRPIERALGFAASVRAGRSYGAGALVADGAVLTALHVVEDRPAPQVRFQDGEWTDAEVLAIDEDADLALLGVERTGRAPAPIASALDVSLGDELVTVGSPRELSFTVHRGDVTYVGRRFGGVRYLQTDLPANPGSSGGPVVDAEGRLVGVMSFVLRGSEGIAFVTPVDYAADMLAAAEVPAEPLAAAGAGFDRWRSASTR